MALEVMKLISLVNVSVGTVTGLYVIWAEILYDDAYEVAIERHSVKIGTESRIPPPAAIVLNLVLRAHFSHQSRYLSKFDV